MFGKFRALSKLGKFSAACAALVVATLLGSSSQPKTTTLQSAKTGVLGAQAGTSASHTTAPSTSPAPTTSQPKAPVVTNKTVTETQPIAFASTTVSSASLPVGTTKITTPGVNGVSTLTYEVTTTNGVQTGKDLISQVTTTPPVTQITSIGTHVAAVAPAPATPNCDPNYTGCVPNVYPQDVDCAGGSGNGPYYAQGPIQVIGTDRYGLDRNHDGTACE